jgi:hypothetical protein
MLKRFLMSTALVGGLALSAGSAQAGVIQLGFILDSSGSIGAGNWTTITTGLSNAINALVPTNSQYEISIVTFSSGTSILVNHVLIDSAATRSAVAAAVAAAPFLNGSTNMGGGFQDMQTALTTSSQTIDFSYVNLATDGVPNTGPDTATAVAAIIAAGIDNISIEAIGSGVDASFLQNVVCYPQSCDTSSPYNFAAQGFYIPVADAAEYAAAIGNKIRIVTHQTPEPATLSLFGLALGGLYLRRRLKKQAA